MGAWARPIIHAPPPFLIYVGCVVNGQDEMGKEATGLCARLKDGTELEGTYVLRDRQRHAYV